MASQAGACRSVIFNNGESILQGIRPVCREKWLYLLSLSVTPKMYMLSVCFGVFVGIPLVSLSCLLQVSQKIYM